MEPNTSNQSQPDQNISNPIAVESTDIANDSPMPGSDALMHKIPGLLGSYFSDWGILYVDKAQKQLRFKNTSGVDEYYVNFQDIKKVKFSQFGQMMLVTAHGKKIFGLYDEKAAVSKDFLNSIILTKFLHRTMPMANNQTQGMLDSYPLQQKWSDLFDSIGIQHDSLTNAFGVRKFFKILAIVTLTLVTLLFIAIALTPKTNY